MPRRAGERGHDDAVGEEEIANLQRREEMRGRVCHVGDWMKSGAGKVRKAEKALFAAFACACYFSNVHRVAGSSRVDTRGLGTMRIQLGGMRAVALAAMAAVIAGGASAWAQATGSKGDDARVELRVDARAATTPFPHFWEQTFGSGRAILSLREEYRDDLRRVKQATGFQSIRFHGIFMDEVGLYDPGRKSTNPGQNAQEVQTNGIYNFSYVDEIYDGLLANGVRPFVELSFMPKGLASDPNALHAFWYKQNVSPPKDYAAWDAMIQAFARHLVERYGIAEVSN